MSIRFYWQGATRCFSWTCPLCEATNIGRLGSEPISGFYRDMKIEPQWVLTGDEACPTLNPSLGCWSCYPDGHYWLRDGVMRRSKP